jgi:hypothetical protein
MKIYIVIASINELLNLYQFKNQLSRNDHEIKVIVIDEGDEKLTDRNRKLLEEIDYRFYGPKERASWFQSRFNNNYEKYSSVTPEHCHAETSFGFLVAYEEEADVVIELDDDVFPVRGHNLVKPHLCNLFKGGGIKVSSKCSWYNNVENLVLDGCYYKAFPRGHPHASEVRLRLYVGRQGCRMCAQYGSLDWSSRSGCNYHTLSQWLRR